MKSIFLPFMFLLPTLLIAQVGVGTTEPSEALDVVGNVALSGALMPDNKAGAPNDFLKSNGSDSPANWVEMDTTYISDFSVKVRSLLSAGDGIDYNSNTGEITNTANSKNYYQAIIPNPGTNNSSDVTMTGLEGSISMSGGTKALVIISGDIAQSGNDGNCTLQIYYGTGTAPSNGNSETGTAIGSEVNIEFKGTGSQIKYPFSTQVIITGLIPETTYWMDLGTTNTGGNSVNINNVSVSAIEL